MHRVACAGALRALRQWCGAMLLCVLISSETRVVLLSLVAAQPPCTVVQQQSAPPVSPAWGNACQGPTGCPHKCTSLPARLHVVLTGCAKLPSGPRGTANPAICKLSDSLSTYLFCFLPAGLPAGGHGQAFSPQLHVPDDSLWRQGQHRQLQPNQLHPGAAGSRGAAHSAHGQRQDPAMLWAL